MDIGQTALAGRGQSRGSFRRVQLCCVLRIAVSLLIKCFMQIIGKVCHLSTHDPCSRTLRTQHLAPNNGLDLWQLPMKAGGPDAAIILNIGSLSLIHVILGFPVVSKT